MFYLVIQTSLILLLTAAVFYALGAGSFYLIYRRRQPTRELPDIAQFSKEENTSSLITVLPDSEQESVSDPLAEEEITDLDPITPPIVDPTELEGLRAALTQLQDQLVEKERVIEELSSAMPAPISPTVVEPSAPGAGDDQLMAKIPQMEAALETQGALLESKSLALEKAKLQLDREKERAALLEQKLMLLETEMNELRSQQVESLWSEPSPMVPVAAAPAADQSAKDTEIAMLNAERETLREELAQLQAANEGMREQLASGDADREAEHLWKDKAETYEAVLAERDRIEQSLRDEIDSLRQQIARHDASKSTNNTQIIDKSLMERLARAEAIATERREESRVREKEIEEKYQARVQELEQIVDKFTWEKEELAKAQGRVETLERAFDVVSAEKEELARDVGRVRELERSIEALEAEKHGLQQFSQRAEELERELETARTSKEEAENRLRDAQREIESLQSETARLAEIQRELEKMRWDVQTHAEKSTRVEELEQRITQLVGEKQKADVTVAHLSSLPQRLEKMQRDLTEQQEAVTAANNQVRALQQQLKDREARAALAEELRQKLLDMEATLDAHEAAALEADSWRLKVRELEDKIRQQEANDGEAERLQLRITELELALQKQRQENDLAWIEAKLDNADRVEPEPDPEPMLPRLTEEPSARSMQAEFERLVTESKARPEPRAMVGAEEIRQLFDEEAALRRRLEEMRSDLLRQESEHWGREEVRLEAIQRKLEQIESEVLSMESLLKRDGGENELVAAIWRVETMLKDEERKLARAGVSPAREAELQQQIARLENELVERERHIERLSRDGVKDHEAERGLLHQVEAMQALVEEREKLIATLKKQLHDLSHKLSPELVGDDNLQLIHGVGPYTKKVLKEEFGITTYRQLAVLSAEDIQRISDRLFFKGRIQREDWLGQAIALHFKKYNELLENPEPPYPMKWAG